MVRHSPTDVLLYSVDSIPALGPPADSPESFTIKVPDEISLPDRLMYLAPGTLFRKIITEIFGPSYRATTFCTSRGL
jgi:hypothetical protein